MLEIKNIDKLSNEYKDLTGVSNFIITADQYKFHINDKLTNEVTIFCLKREADHLGFYKLWCQNKAVAPADLPIEDIKDVKEFIKWINYLNGDVWPKKQC